MAARYGCIMSQTEHPASKEMIHRVCNWLREESALNAGCDAVPCRKCELVVSCGPYGDGVLGCVLRAQELIEIVREVK